MQVSAFFARMREEELSHRDIVRFQRRVMFGNPGDHLELEGYDEDALDRTVRSVEDLIARVNADLGRLVEHPGCCDRAHAARLDAFALAHAESSSYWTA